MSLESQSAVEDRVRAYVAAVLRDCEAPERVVAVDRFDSGENHAVFRVAYRDIRGEDVRVVVRVASSPRACDPVAARREATVHSAVQGLVAPLLYDFRLSSSWFDAPSLCMQFVDGEQRDASTSAEFELLGSLMGRLHETKIEALADSLQGFSNLEGYLDSRISKNVEKFGYLATFPATYASRLMAAHRQIERRLLPVRHSPSLQAPEPCALLHGDVGEGNIVWRPEPVLIDWEYARLGDPGDEIAYILSQKERSPAQRKSFWIGYQQGRKAGTDLQHVLQRSVWWEAVSLLGSAFFWVQQWAQAEPQREGSSALDREGCLAKVLERLGQVELRLTQAF